MHSFPLNKNLGGNARKAEHLGKIWINDLTQF